MNPVVEEDSYGILLATMFIAKGKMGLERIGNKKTQYDGVF